MTRAAPDYRIPGHNLQQPAAAMIKGAKMISGSDFEAFRRSVAAGITPAAIRRRILLVAAEKALPSDEVSLALKNARAPGCLSNFAARHGLSYAWLAWGDIRGLRASVRSKNSS